MTATLTPSSQRPPKVRTKQAATKSIFDRAIVSRAAVDSFKKLNPRTMMRNPVMFIVWVGSLLTTLLFIRDFGDSDTQENVFAGLVSVWLWFTVLFANFAEAMAEGRGKAQADTLRRTRAETTARVRRPDGTITSKASSQLDLGDVCIVSAGEIIPGDGEIIEGIATVDESAITGESAPVIRESGGDRSAVTGGTRVLSDEIAVQITARPGETFLDRMIALVEGANRQKTPNEIALTILLAGLTIVFLLAVVTLQPFAIYSGAEQSIIVLVALLVCLIPTTIGGLLSAIGIAGMDRLVQRNVLAMSGRAVEAAGDVTTLLLDKTGTITYGSRQASEFIPVTGIDEKRVAEAALMSSLADETPEGRSIVDLAIERFALVPVEDPGAALVPFTAQTRMSGMDLTSGRMVRKGAAESVRRFVETEGGSFPLEVLPIVEGVSRDGATPLVVIDKPAGDDDQWSVLGVIRLKDTVKPGMSDRFDHLRLMGIRTVMITGDNPLTAAAIAEEAGVDDFLAEATPEDKMALIKREQRGGNLVAMTGDGTNDAPALAQADVGVAMNTGTQAAKEAGNMVDLDSNPTKLIEIVEVGKQLLITRGSLTTFSIANDVAKYFAIIPAMFSGVLPVLDDLNVMNLHSPRTAILSAVIFNALIIVALVPLALRGVKFRAESASAVLRRNLLIFGLGGIIAPFIGIKLIDVIITALRSQLMRAYIRQLGPAFLAVVVFTLICGVAYPLLATAIGQVAFGHEADGSLIERDGEVVGSELIGQVFTDAKYFHTRPSAAGDGYDGSASSGSNLGPTNPDLLAAIEERSIAYRETNSLAPDARVPVDAVTASGSGLDPHISVANARIQASRVATMRGLEVDAVLELVADYTDGRDLGILGEPGVNVVRLNLALDDLAP